MKFCYALFALMFSAATMKAQTYVGTGGIIPDDATNAIDFPINVASLLPANVNAAHGVVAVCLNINHTWDSDLQISLIAPDGTMVALASSVGGSDDNFTNTCFQQGASNSIINGTAPFMGVWKPIGNLGYCNNGQNGNGVWKLHIFDAVPQDQGTLLNWEITFDNNAPVVTPFTTSNLPLVIINTGNQNIPDNPKIMASMGIVYNGVGVLNHTTDVYNNYNGKIGIELRGSTSQTFPKKSYGFNTWTNTGADTSAMLLGMPKESEWILSANYSDKSMMNNVLAYRLFQLMGSYAPRTRFVELIINNQYQGVYVLMEKIKRDSNRVDVSKLTTNDSLGSALTGGYILKIDKNTGSGGGGFTSNYTPLVNANGQTIFFQYDYPSDTKITQQQKHYIQLFVDSFENALHNVSLYDTLKGWRRFAGENSFVKYFILNEISKNVDGYRLSTYLYKSKDTHGNKLHIGPPWDYDIAFANANYCGGNVDTGWAFNFGMECSGDVFQVPFWWKKLMSDTSFQNHLKCTYDSLRTTILDTTNLFHWIDSVALFLNNAKDRNFDIWPILGLYVWPNPSPIPASYAGEIEELKIWLRKRLHWMDAHIPGTCYPPPVSIEGVSKNSLTIFPNPFTNELNVRLNYPGYYSLKLVGIDGRIVLEKVINITVGSVFNIIHQDEKLAQGFYLLQVHSAQGSECFKVMKE